MSSTATPTAVPSASGEAVVTLQEQVQSLQEQLDAARQQAAEGCASGSSSVCTALLRLTGDRELSQNVDVAFQLVVRPVAQIVVVLVLAVLTRRVLHRLIARLSNRLAEQRRPGTSTAPGALSALVQDDRRAARAHTLGSVLKTISTLATLLVAALTVLAVLSVPITPLLAGFGVVGLALGFGSQSLVKDVVAGLFMLIEDQYGVGDVVDLGEASGTVEAVNLRVTRLRDVDGTVWHVRNGEIPRVGNKSQGWARAVLDLNVGWGEDLDRAQQVMLDEARTLYREPGFRSMVLGEPELWGVEALTDDWVVIRLVIKTRPTQQWAVARALRGRVKRRFHREGIDMTPLAARAHLLNDPTHPADPADPADPASPMGSQQPSAGHEEG